MHNIETPESVAEHSFHVSKIGASRDKAMRMVTIHEIDEVEIGDISPFFKLKI